MIAPADTCGCCEPPADLVPLAVDNRPSLPQVARRIGTFASFRATMLERLAATPELRLLSIRRSDDHAILLLELWAAVADVLTFYTERHFNEQLLRTASQVASIQRLVRLVGYRPRPGISAAVELAFTMQEGARLVLPAGSRMVSRPEPGERPQTFETSAPATLDARRNRLRAFGEPAPLRPLAAGSNEATISLRTAKAVLGAVAPGDHLLFVRAAPRVFSAHGAVDGLIEEKDVESITTEEWRATLRWTPPLANDYSIRRGRAFVRDRTFRLFGHDAPSLMPQPEEVAASPRRSGLSLTQLAGGASGRDEPRLVRWRLTRISPAYAPGGLPGPPYGTIDLDGDHEGLRVGAELLVHNPRGISVIVTVTSVQRASRSLPGAAPRGVTRLGVAPAVPAIAVTADVTVHELVLELEPLKRACGPPRPAVEGAICVPGPLVERDGERAILAGAQLRAGELAGVALTAEDFATGSLLLLADASGAVALGSVDEPARVIVDGEGVAHLRIALRMIRSADLDPATTELCGNVVRATHGETVRDEPLGEGAPSAVLTLSRSPLAYVPSATAPGIRSTLELRAGGLAWSETSRLYGRGPGDRVFSVDHGPDGATAVRFGDGSTGAAPPVGRGNVTATYRVGGGLAARVAAGAVRTVIDRPPGLLDVTNPAPAYGGADPESVEDVRTNAPQALRTFGRAVSLRDFEQLARSTGEVAKASAVRMWDGRAHTVHVTVAAQAGGTFPPDQLSRIGKALATASDPGVRVRLANHVARDVRVTVTLRTAPDHDADAVIAAARASLLGALSFERLQLGQSLHLSDVYAALHGVDGVVGVDVDRFAALDERGARARSHLRVRGARPDPGRPGRVLPAELASVADPARDILLRAEAVA